MLSCCLFVCFIPSEGGLRRVLNRKSLIKAADEWWKMQGEEKNLCFMTISMSVDFQPVEKEWCRRQNNGIFCQQMLISSSSFMFSYSNDCWCSHSAPCRVDFVEKVFEATKIAPDICTYARHKTYCVNVLTGDLMAGSESWCPSGLNLQPSLTRDWISFLPSSSAIHFCDYVWEFRQSLCETTNLCIFLNWVEFSQWNVDSFYSTIKSLKWNFNASNEVFAFTWWKNKHYSEMCTKYSRREQR